MPPRFGMGAWGRLAECRFQRARRLRAKLDLRLEADQSYRSPRQALNECTSFHMSPHLPGSMLHDRWGLGHFLGFDWPFLHSKPVCFEFVFVKNQFVLSLFFGTFVDSKGLIEFVPSILTSFSHFPHFFPFWVLSQFGP
jgi:hypothetical protein